MGGVFRTSGLSNDQSTLKQPGEDFVPHQDPSRFDPWSVSCGGVYTAQQHDALVQLRVQHLEQVGGCPWTVNIYYQHAFDLSEPIQQSFESMIVKVWNVDFRMCYRYGNIS